MKRLWSDERGFVVSAELIMIATIAVIGLMVGLVSVRDSVISELSDVVGAVQDQNQSYSLDGVVGHNANTAGFNFEDDLDECDDDDDVADEADNCISFNMPGGNGEPQGIEGSGVGFDGDPLFRNGGT